MPLPAAASAVILLIDPDATSRASIRETLQQAGYGCHAAADANSAWQIATTVPLDIIISDVRLPTISGLEFCQDLRQQLAMEDLPVIYISVAQLPDIVRRSHDAGGAYYLRKPVDPEVLLEITSKALWLPHLVTSRLRYEQGSPAFKPASHLPHRSTRVATTQAL